jgi:hypothetical protein
MVTAISHLCAEPDWFALRLQTPSQCAESIQSILKALEGAERFVYAIRGEALRLFDDRKLFLLYKDPATNQPFTCTFRYLQVLFPDSARYCQEALVSRQRLCNAVPLEQAVKMTRDNIKLLEQASESVRALPEVHKAAETMTKAQFAAKLSRDFHQHLEESQRLTFKLTGSDYGAVIEALDTVGKLMSIEDRAGQLVSLCIDFMLERQP